VIAGRALPPDCSVKFAQFCFNHAMNPQHIQCAQGSHVKNSPHNITTKRKTMYKTIKPIIQIAAILVLASAGTIQAQDKKLELTGTWKSSMTNQNDQIRETTFKLKAEGEKVTGTISGRNNDTPIEEGTIKGDEVSFKVTREMNGNKRVTKYTGKISGDTIKGKSESERDGQPTSRDWVAKREAAPKAEPAK
jgi:hypothetical protein